MSLNGKTVLITGGALRIGRSLALAVAQAGADVVLHFGKSHKEAESAQAGDRGDRPESLPPAGRPGRRRPGGDVDFQAREHAPLFALVNNASVFEPHVGRIPAWSSGTGPWRST